MKICETCVAIISLGNTVLTWIAILVFFLSLKISLEKGPVEPKVLEKIELRKIRQEFPKTGFWEGGRNFLANKLVCVHFQQKGQFIGNFKKIR